MLFSDRFSDNTLQRSSHLTRYLFPYSPLTVSVTTLLVMKELPTLQMLWRSTLLWECWSMCCVCCGPHLLKYLFYLSSLILASLEVSPLPILSFLRLLKYLLYLCSLILASFEISLLPMLSHSCVFWNIPSTYALSFLRLLKYPFYLCSLILASPPIDILLCVCSILFLFQNIVTVF